MSGRQQRIILQNATGAPGNQGKYLTVQENKELNDCLSVIKVKEVDA